MTNKEFREHIGGLTERKMRALLADTDLECVEVNLPKGATQPLRFRKDDDPRNQWVSFAEVKRILEDLGRI